jgi:hypothetical protein
MAFKHIDEKKGLSLPGMIDIIFLLLVFSLVTLSVSQANVEAEKRGEKGVESDLPKTASANTQELDERIRTLVFEVAYEDPQNHRSPRIVYILKPSKGDSLTFAEAKMIAKRDSLFAEFPPNFLALSDQAFGQTMACRLIRQSLQDYKDEHFFEPGPTNCIEIRAVRETEFRIINYILGCCSAYGDTIPNIAMHTLTQREGGRGI